MFGEEKKYFVLGQLEQQRQNRYLVYRHNKPNKPPKEGPLSIVLFESPFTSVSIVSKGHTSLCSLSGGWQHGQINFFMHYCCNSPRLYPCIQMTNVKIFNDDISLMFLPPSLLHGIGPLCSVKTIGQGYRLLSMFIPCSMKYEYVTVRE
jgi:hypothetical protein